MKKFTICISKEKDGNISAFNPKYGNIVVKGDSEQEVTDKLKMKILEWLKSSPEKKEWLMEFNEIKDNIRLRHLKI